MLLSRWAKFQKDVLVDVAYRMAGSVLLQDVRDNEWWKEGSEKHNFFARKDGTPFCVADVKKDITDYSMEKFGFVPNLP